VKRPCLLALAALLAAGCAKNNVQPAINFRSPDAVALFHGYLRDHPGDLRSYVAVANTGLDDLRFIDALDSKAVLAPALVAALSVSTDARPALLAASSLHDATPLADLLVVGFHGLSLSTGTTTPSAPSAHLQVVGTWNWQTVVAADIDLGPVAGDAEVLAMAAAAIPDPDGAGGFIPRAGAARLYLLLSGDQLGVVDFKRAGDQVAIVQDGAVTLQPLGFQPVALSLAQGDPTRLYLATTDPLPGGVLGAAELDVTVPMPFPVRPLSALAPTVAVAAVDFRAFNGFTTDPGLDTFEDQPRRRIFVLPAGGSCGRDDLVECGLLAIDPVSGTLSADPAGQAPFQQPMRIPGSGLSIAATGPSSVAPLPGLLQIAPGSGKRYTTALMAIPSTAGRVYLADPAHYAVPNDGSFLDGTLRTRAVRSASTLPATPLGVSRPSTALYLGIWNEAALPDPIVLIGAAAVSSPQIKVTPGFTNSEVWSIVWQGPLPGLANRTSVLHANGAGLDWLAVQESTGLTGDGALRGVARLYDPRLGVLPGDRLVVDATGVLTAAGDVACPNGPFELKIDALRPPASTYPGGALTVSVDTGTSQPTWARDTSGGFLKDVLGNFIAYDPRTEPAGSIPADPHCLDAGAAGGVDVAVLSTIRARELVATGSISGYSGRPELVLSQPDTGTPFTVEYVDERTLSCPILGDRVDQWPPSDTAVAACEADVPTCRRNCEQLLLARHARRLSYVTDRCTSVACSGAGTPGSPNYSPGYWPGMTFPNPAGPALQFKVGLNSSSSTVQSPGTPLRDAALQITTDSGYAPASRSPYSGSTATAAVLPTGMVFFDKAATTGNASDGFRGFASFVDQLVFDFPVNDAITNGTIHR
jgi:hypothetical protein